MKINLHIAKSAVALFLAAISAQADGPTEINKMEDPEARDIEYGIERTKGYDEEERVGEHTTQDELESARARLKRLEDKSEAPSPWQETVPTVERPQNKPYRDE